MFLCRVVVFTFVIVVQVCVFFYSFFPFFGGVAEGGVSVCVCVCKSAMYACPAASYTNTPSAISTTSGRPLTHISAAS